MFDVVCVMLALAFFAAAWLLVRACQALEHEDE